MIDTERAKLWMKLAYEFNVAVAAIWTGLEDDNKTPCTRVILDQNKVDPAVITALPQDFAGEKVYYRVGKPPQFAGGAEANNPPCGQPGHQCGCTPK